jgi:hypothetical protein
MGFVTEFFDCLDFSVKDRFEVFTGDREDNIDVLEFDLAFRHVHLIFSIFGLLFEFYDFLFCGVVSDHFAKVSKERPGVIIRVSFFVNDLTLLIVLLFVLWSLIGFRFFL